LGLLVAEVDDSLVLRQTMTLGSRGTTAEYVSGSAANKYRVP
jgi:hypothetical protein